MTSLVYYLRRSVKIARLIITQPKPPPIRATRPCGGRVPLCFLALSLARETTSTGFPPVCHPLALPLLNLAHNLLCNFPPGSLLLVTKRKVRRSPCSRACSSCRTRRAPSCGCARQSRLMRCGLILVVRYVNAASNRSFSLYPRSSTRRMTMVWCSVLLLTGAEAGAHERNAPAHHKVQLVGEELPCHAARQHGVRAHPGRSAAKENGIGCFQTTTAMSAPCCPNLHVLLHH